LPVLSANWVSGGIGTKNRPHSVSLHLAHLERRHHNISSTDPIGFVERLCQFHYTPSLVDHDPFYARLHRLGYGGLLAWVRFACPRTKSRNTPMGLGATPGTVLYLKLELKLLARPTQSHPSAQPPGACSQSVTGGPACSHGASTWNTAPYIRRSAVPRVTLFPFERRRFYFIF